MSLRKNNDKSFAFSLTAGVLITLNAAALGTAAKWFPWVIPTFPGSSGNDAAVLFGLSALGLAFGVFVVLAALMLRSKPKNSKILGLFVAVFSVLSLVTGGGFLVGCVLGVYAAKKAVSLSSCY